LSYLVISGRGGAGPGDLTDAGRQFLRFHHFPPLGTVRCPHRRLIPEVLVQLGKLRALIYPSDRTRPGEHRTYIHFMETPPRLTCDPSGTQLYVVGGRYRITPRGIEG